MWAPPDKALLPRYHDKAPSMAPRFNLLGVDGGTKGGAIGGDVARWSPPYPPA
ncbi:hypothetical protein HanHA300_Chr11g0409781 [Helianthus annuus]|nr:hypothetical protein HanHA300_Chr11g0409781 [Helianthus annuus]KAJ0510160.1 hypothetical protein HanIR_Chr11g0537511 [Helianthus annuus]KAJ0518101.1 hypothetical protein HanHA89_Chr11g0433461 [Helianthus annuus]KAJ0686127.1 hypothetical protein HanLR1_Chr11g0411061 [Helianthus annuus]